MIFWQTTWLIVGLSMLAAELFNPGIFFALSLSAGAFGAALLGYLDFKIEIQFLCFLILSVASFLGLSTLLARNGFSKTISKKESTNVDALVGQIGVVTQGCNIEEKGLAKVAGELWSIVNSSSVEINTGDKVKVLKIEGNRLFVNKIEETQ